MQFKGGWLWSQAFCLIFLAACSSAKKKTEPVLSELNGKKVALMAVDGELTAKKVVEVALVNELSKRGTFILMSKQDIDAVRLAPEQNPTDWKGIAQKAGADYALRAEILKFDATNHEGYSSEKVYDSQLAEEQGTDGQTERLYKVKTLEGHVLVRLEFNRLSDPDIRVADAEASDRVEADTRTSAIHLPPRLRFLEDLCYKAFRKFFDQYN